MIAMSVVAIWWLATGTWRDALRAQAPAAGIAGRVVDTVGQPLPGVTIKAVNAATLVTTQVMSSGDGSYQFDGVADGIYRVDIDLQSFDLIRANHVRVVQGSTARVDGTLSISATCECVTVAYPTALTVRRGQVVDASNRPLAYARLEVVSPLRSDVTLADAEGRFTVRLPIEGTWPLTASDSGFAAVTQQLSGNGPPIVITLPRLTTFPPSSIEKFGRGCRCPGELFVRDK
jgi:hypothetical protein